MQAFWSALLAALVGRERGCPVRSNAWNVWRDSYGQVANAAASWIGANAVP